MTNEDLIHVNEKNSIIEFIGQTFTLECATLIADKVREAVLIRQQHSLLLNLESVRHIDLEAAGVITHLANLVRGKSDPYVFDNIFLGLEQLTEKTARLIAQWPAYFLHFDQLTCLPENVAMQFIHTRHALTFDGCKEFTTATLAALIQSAQLLSLGLTEVSREQAVILSVFKGDLLLRGNDFSEEILTLLKKNANLCLPPDYDVLEFPSCEALQT